MKEEKLEEFLAGKTKEQFLIGVQKDLAQFNSTCTKYLKNSSSKVLVYSLATNDIIFQGFSPEEIEVVSMKDYNLIDFYKKQSKNFQRKSSRCLSFEKKKKDKHEVYRYSKRGSLKTIKPTVIKYDNFADSNFFGRLIELSLRFVHPRLAEEVPSRRHPRRFA